MKDTHQYVWAKGTKVNGMIKNQKLTRNYFVKWHYHTHPDRVISGGGDIDDPSIDDEYYKNQTPTMQHFIFNVNGKIPY